MASIKRLRFRGDLSARECISIVAHKALEGGADVNAYNVALLDDYILRGMPWINHIVHGNTGAGRESAVTEESGDCPLFLDITACNAVDLPGGNTRVRPLLQQSAAPVAAILPASRITASSTAWF